MNQNQNNVNDLITLKNLKKSNSNCELALVKRYRIILHRVCRIAIYNWFALIGQD